MLCRSSADRVSSVGEQGILQTVSPFLLSATLAADLSDLHRIVGGIRIGDVQPSVDNLGFQNLPSLVTFIAFVAFFSVRTVFVVNSVFSVLTLCAILAVLARLSLFALRTCRLSLFVARSQNRHCQ